MKVSTKNIKKIKSRLDYLYDNFNIEEAVDEVKIGDDSIFIGFPDEWNEENSNYSIEDFLDYTDDLNNIKVVSNHSVICGKISQTIIDVNDYYYDNLVPQIEFETDNLTMKIIHYPFLIGIIASKEGIYNEDFGVFPCSDYMAVEIRYKQLPNSEVQSIEFIKQALYYIAAEYGVPVSIGEFRSWDDITGKESSGRDVVYERDLLPYTSAMDLYVKALTIENVDVQYLYFYKIIEYFSPIVSKKYSYEQLNQRLDTIHIGVRTHEYLDSIFQLTKQYEVSLKDSELAFTVLAECIDILTIFGLLPENIKKKITKECKFEIKNIRMLKPMQVIEIKKKIGSILYATRNSIVHAKSNYNATSKECIIEDLDQLNTFMAALCKCLIIWNGRQPAEFQLK